MNTDKILYLHIGMPKTGTSSLQLFLMQNPEALAQNNCSYPMMPGRYPMVSPNRNAHFLVGKIMNADGSADILFEQPQRAVTPGQSAVFYDGDQVLGGGTILAPVADGE